MRPALALVLILAGAAGCAGSHPPVAAAPSAFAMPEAGPRSREAFRSALAAYDEAVARGASATELEARVDQIAALAAQRDAHVSRLYWLTDLDAAKAEAQRTHRPILSLRMLGRLDEEWSCANSRFFRTTLYSNPAVAAYLREHFVLHWSSERPAPKMTIDFGNGHRVVRTVTGNSIHYVLDANGRVVDALPGLYAAEAFVGALREAEALAVSNANKDDRAAEAAVMAAHQRLLGEADARFAALAAAANRADLRLPPPIVRLNPPPAPPAGVAVNVAMPKAVVERPLVAAVVPQAPAMPGVMDFTDDDVPGFEKVPWSSVARTYAPHLDPTSLALMRSKSPRDWSGVYGPRPGKAPGVLDDRRFSAMVGAFERKLAEDTLKNDLGVRSVIHAFLAAAPGTSVEKLNEWVYSTLFLTPASDPWLGLLPPGAYTGLPDDGLVR